EAGRLAAAAQAEGATAIIAAGGDGTLNEIVNGIAPSDVPVGLLPLGTANVFARELGLPLRLPAAWQCIQQGRTRRVDLGFVEFNSQRRYFVQLAGIGFDAAAVRAARWEQKKQLGPLAYVLAGLRVLRQTPCPPAILVGNGRYYGGPFRVFPHAQLTDGKLDICICERPGLPLVWAVLAGRHLQRPDVRYFQTDSFTHDGQLWVEVDGELAGTTPVRLGVLPRGLCVIAPGDTPHVS
ncbi:MAG: diacylglycerol kinase family lipid kinase, partial [Verrucomicrobiae bacterium]|nr:diacylglycerol kinase family lipid kinase [Verrucomicrobiae bacterium]